MMLPWTFYSALLAMVGSIISLTRIAIAYRTPSAPSVSERAASDITALRVFRAVLFMCGSLFAYSIYFFVAPKAHQPAIALTWSIEYIGVILTAIIPAHGRTLPLHTATAHFMGIGMLSLAYVFWLTVSGSARLVELAMALLMTIFVILMWVDRPRYIFHELGFIYLSHLTIVVAALALYI